jgi:hypothetical protein
LATLLISLQLSTYPPIFLLNHPSRHSGPHPSTKPSISPVWSVYIYSAAHLLFLSASHYSATHLPILIHILYSVTHLFLKKNFTFRFQAIWKYQQAQSSKKMCESLVHTFFKNIYFGFFLLTPNKKIVKRLLLIK